MHDLVSAAGPDAVIALEAPTPVDAGPAADPGVIALDRKPRAAFRDGRLLGLSRLEYDLLLFFAEHPRQVFSRSQLLARVWATCTPAPVPSTCTSAGCATGSTTRS